MVINEFNKTDSDYMVSLTDYGFTGTSEQGKMKLQAQMMAGKAPEKPAEEPAPEEAPEKPVEEPASETEGETEKEAIEAPLVFPNPCSEQFDLSERGAVLFDAAVAARNRTPNSDICIPEVLRNL